MRRARRRIAGEGGALRGGADVATAVIGGS